MLAKGKPVKKVNIVNIDFERLIQVWVNPVPLYQLRKKETQVTPDVSQMTFS